VRPSLRINVAADGTVSNKTDAPEQIAAMAYSLHGQSDVASENANNRSTIDDQWLGTRMVSG